MRRHHENPIIKPSEVKPSTDGFEVIGAFNPGAVIHDGQVILLLRIAERCAPAPGKVRAPAYKFKGGRGTPVVREFDENDPELSFKDTRGVVYQGKDYLSSMSHVRVARSEDGVHFTVDDEPFIHPCDPTEEYGVEDARATRIDGRYYVNYSIVSQDSWCTALSVTDDFVSHRKMGIIFHPENKDVAIFPEKIKGKHVALHRPNNNGFGKASIWYAESPDLIHWGNHRCLARPRDSSHESMKIGGGAPPIKTAEGWLCLYHAKGDGQRYSLFPMLLDLDEPWKIIKRPERPIFEPEESYETNGFFGNVVFTNGMVEKDGQLLIYYGASDETTCLAISSVEEMLSSF